MNKSLPGQYVPELHRVLCPSPMRPLHLWFTLQWLEGPHARALQNIQRTSHRNPPEIPELGDEERRLQSISSDWENWYRSPLHGLLPPNTAMVIGARHTMSLMSAAGKLLFVALRQEHKKRKLSKSLGEFNPFAAWHELVNGRPTNTGLEVQESLYADLDLRGLIMEDGEEAANAVSYAIMSAIENKLKSMNPAPIEA